MYCSKKGNVTFHGRMVSRRLTQTLKLTRWRLYLDDQKQTKGGRGAVSKVEGDSGRSWVISSPSLWIDMDAGTADIFFAPKTTDGCLKWELKRRTADPRGGLIVRRDLNSRASPMGV